MSAVKLQDRRSKYKNQLHFYIQAMNIKKEIKKTITFTIYPKK